MLELCFKWRDAISVPCSLPGISIAVFFRPPSCINDSPAALARPLTNIDAFKPDYCTHIRRGAAANTRARAFLHFCRSSAEGIVDPTDWGEAGNDNELEGVGAK